MFQKLYEVRVDTDRNRRMSVGDELCFFAGRWVLYCDIWCIHKVIGLDELLRRFNWSYLMPNATCEHDCRLKYTELGCSNATKLIVWGVSPNSVKLRGYQKGVRVNFSLDVHNIAKRELSEMHTQ